eukprot:CAMPEP_0171326216 /NCGR_PEP_ID=MMETSP0816-20121228/117311_1 /TAXON_ID=420281 /ORGANISM="Proboscia inermis, Strain CCAP1064/1" /LENGTH=96 /DNA_ID=CAMNT_0011825617 /DNA_START=1157 /DNA_END=1447 /DNA_ORIENTATION=-
MIRSASAPNILPTATNSRLLEVLEGVDAVSMRVISATGVEGVGWKTMTGQGAYVGIVKHILDGSVPFVNTGGISRQNNPFDNNPIGIGSQHAPHRH